MTPEGSVVNRFGSRPRTLTVCRGPVALAGWTGLPDESTVGTSDRLLPFTTPGKKRKFPCSALCVYTTSFARLKFRSVKPSKIPLKNVLFFLRGPLKRASGEPVGAAASDHLNLSGATPVFGVGG